jgi:hypothetical protein
MGDWRAVRSLAAVTFLVGAFSAATMVSCGGGGGGSSNGGLCEQCGDTDGPCNIDGADLTSDQTQPAFCPNGANGACHVELICTRKLDSAQRRCFPADPNTGALDLRYECDGSRPQATPVPTATATSTATPTESATPTISATPTGPTPTGATPTPGTSATPAATATPAEQDISVDIDVSTNADNFTAGITVTVTYPVAKGSFGGGAIDCSSDTDGTTQTDNGNGTLVLTIPANPDGFSETDFTSCVFHQKAGAELVDGDLVGTPSSNQITVDISF